MRTKEYHEISWVGRAPHAHIPTIPPCASRSRICSVQTRRKTSASPWPSPGWWGRMCPKHGTFLSALLLRAVPKAALDSQRICGCEDPPLDQQWEIRCIPSAAWLSDMVGYSWKNCVHMETKDSSHLIHEMTPRSSQARITRAGQGSHLERVEGGKC